MSTYDATGQRIAPAAKQRKALKAPPLPKGARLPAGLGPITEEDITLMQSMTDGIEPIGEPIRNAAKKVDNQRVRVNDVRAFASGAFPGVRFQGKAR